MFLRTVLTLVALGFGLSVRAEALPPVVAQCDSGLVYWDGNKLEPPFQLMADESTFSVNGYLFFQQLPAPPLDALTADVVEAHRRLCGCSKSLEERQRALADVYRRHTERVDSVSTADGMVRIYYRGKPRPVRLFMRDCTSVLTEPEARSFEMMARYQRQLNRGGIILGGEGLPEVYVPLKRVAVATDFITRLIREDVPTDELAAANLSSLNLFTAVFRQPKPLPQCREEVRD